MRDRHELELIRAFVAAGKPLFGICRGLQLLNVACGGTLWQDLPTQRPQSLEHRVSGRDEQHPHAIEFVPGTRLLDDRAILADFVAAAAAQRESVK